MLKVRLLNVCCVATIILRSLIINIYRLSVWMLHVSCYYTRSRPVLCMLNFCIDLEYPLQATDLNAKRLL